MSPLPFTLDDLDNTLNQEARDAICGLILSWARYDSLVSQLMILAFGLTLDGGPILLGNMETRVKLDRLKKLYDHHGMTSAAESIGNLRQYHREFVDVRNSVAHSACAGQRRSNRDYLVFAPVKPMPGELGQMIVEQISIDGIKRAEKFARQAGDKLVSVTDQIVIRPSITPPEPPSFPPMSPPSPQKSAGKAKKSPPRSKSV